MTCIGEDCDQIVRASNAKEEEWGEPGKKMEIVLDWNQWSMGIIARLTYNIFAYIVY